MMPEKSSSEKPDPNSPTDRSEEIKALQQRWAKKNGQTQPPPASPPEEEDNSTPLVPPAISPLPGTP